jgi:hypothetical protein
VTIAFEVDEEEERVVVLAVYYRGRDVIAALKERLP